MENNQKLVVLFNATQTEYCVLAHNSTPENAQDVVKLNADRGVPLVLDQHRPHKTESAIDCRTCREIVVQQLKMQPKPKFVRQFTAQAAPEARNV
jgi:hypothetical protein